MSNTSAQYTLIYIPDSETITIVFISVSYDTELQVSTDEANRLIETYNNEDIECPISLNGNLITTENLDNIDHNPSCTSSCDSFHGTEIYIIQHMAHDNQGVPRIHQHNT